MSRARRRTELEQLLAVLGGARGEGDVLVADWLARLQAVPDGAAHATVLIRAYRHGAGYARPAPVDRDAAIQRLVDVARCGPPSPGKVQLVAADGGWEGLLPHSAGNKRIHIDAATGAMRLAGAAPRRKR